MQSYLEHRETLGTILLDMEMPGLGGTATHRELQRLGSSLPVLFMSGYSKDQSLKNVSQSTSIDFLQKPFSVDTLIESLQKLGS